MTGRLIGAALVAASGWLAAAGLARWRRFDEMRAEMRAWLDDGPGEPV